MATPDQPPAADNISDNVAITRLFDLALNGDTENREFWELDSLVLERLLQAYGVSGALNYVTSTSSS